jgi:hypothetical protein
MSAWWCRCSWRPTRPTLARWPWCYERLGGNRHFTIKDVRRLADYFKVDPGVFFVEPRKLLARTSAQSSTVSVDTVG